MVMLPGELRSRLRGPLAFPITPFDERAGRRSRRAARQRASAAARQARRDRGGRRHRGALFARAGRTPRPSSARWSRRARAPCRSSRASASTPRSDVSSRPTPRAPARTASSRSRRTTRRPTTKGCSTYYRAIAGATPLGMLIYSRDWFHPGAALVERLAGIETLIAWKDGQGDIRRLQILMDRVGDRLHWIGGAGDDMVPAYYAAGLRAYTSSVSNVSPRLALAPARLRVGGGPAAARDHVGADRAALCAARAAARLRGQRDEGDDGHDGAGRRTGASAAHGRRRGDRRSVARPGGEVPAWHANP